MAETTRTEIEGTDKLQLLEALWDAEGRIAFLMEVFLQMQALGEQVTFSACAVNGLRASLEDVDNKLGDVIGALRCPG